MNCLADLKILKNTSWHLIKWYFLAELHSIQPEDTLDLANKLKGKQIDHMRSNMDVRLAAQTLSSPVIVKKAKMDFIKTVVGKRILMAVVNHSFCSTSKLLHGQLETVST
ncbi:hypothetical protein RRG08_039068 [Elysia crispata]|uniref:Transposable element P transposase-like GTP-binding insertion domain-containing protein n=1 Tax=Elysia crispata TaxID=231223 RepID=A0AAE1CZ75_9GAST|nr:hypothetical protein RRG08_039068 [Elysia crispata]